MSASINEILQNYSNKDIDIMNIINEDDKYLLKNQRNIKLNRIDWGKNFSIINQYIQKEILSYILHPYGYYVFTTDETDDENFPKNINITNNSPGFDIIIKSMKEEKFFRVQSKLRQVKGKTPFSKQVNIETTRRHSKKNMERCYTGHICYDTDEFDFVMISLVHDRNNRLSIIQDCNKWFFSFIPKTELIDSQKKCIVPKIVPKIIEKYKIL